MQNPAVRLESPLPVRYDRVQLVLRILILVGLGILGGSVGWLYTLLYILLPVLAAAAASGNATPEQRARDVGRIETIVRWAAEFFAYMGMVTDTPPWAPGGSPVRVEIVRPASTVTTGSAVLRLLKSIPAAIVVALANVVACFAALFAMLTVLVDRTVSPGIHGFLLRVTAMNVRLLGYHGSLVDEYPLASTETPAATTHPT